MSDCCLLLDNGSLRADATLALRGVARRLAAVLDREIVPVSLMHSNKVPAEELEGTPAETFEKAIRARASRGIDHFCVVPMFFGPSRALTKFIPLTVSVLRVDFPKLKVRLAPPLVDLGMPRDNRVATILCDRVIETIQTHELDQPAVAMIDHGSPLRQVAEVRNHVGSQLSLLLTGYCRTFSVGSMERREGPDYAFNEPLLENLLKHPDFADGPVVVSLLFLSPGRHAGANGDIAQICVDAEKFAPRPLKTYLTGLVGDHPLLLSILAERYLQAQNAMPVLSS